MSTTTTEYADYVRADRIRVRCRAADALRREINSWVSELENYPEHFTAGETAKIAELLKLSRALTVSLEARRWTRERS